MLLALGAVSSALDALKTLSSTKSSQPQTTGLTQDPANPFDLSGATQASKSTTAASRPGGSPLAPETMSALLAAQSQSTTAPTSRSNALKDLFGQIDANGDGLLSQSEFENALGAGGTNTAEADDVFSKMDKDGDGSVSLDEMLSALKGGKARHHHHHVADSDSSSTDESNSNPLLKALQGATSTSVTNSDGSSTTSLTYPDGSTVTMTTAAKAAASGAATSSYNFIEQMIAREARTISSASLPSLSVSV
jgi:hypothetical protein